MAALEWAAYNLVGVLCATAGFVGLATYLLVTGDTLRALVFFIMAALWLGTATRLAKRFVVFRRLVSKR